MRIRVITLVGLSVIMILITCYQVIWAGPKEVISSSESVSIGIVSIQKVLADCKRSAEYREKVIAERDKILAELEKLQADIEADRAGLATLKTGSSDHIALIKQLLNKQASLQAQQKFHEQEMALREQRLIEDIYREALGVISEIAKEKGLSLVLEKTEPDLPSSDGNELARMIAGNKVLYSSPQMDISGEVLARLDSRK